jgi:hypothetical protein
MCRMSHLLAATPSAFAIMSTAFFAESDAQPVSLINGKDASPSAHRLACRNGYVLVLPR